MSYYSFKLKYFKNFSLVVSKLIVKARFNKILNRIADEDLRNEIIEEIEERLD